MRIFRIYTHLYRWLPHCSDSRIAIKSHHGYVRSPRFSVDSFSFYFMFESMPVFLRCISAPPTNGEHSSPFDGAQNNVRIKMLLFFLSSLRSTLLFSFIICSFLRSLSWCCGRFASEWNGISSDAAVVLFTKHSPCQLPPFDSANMPSIVWTHSKSLYWRRIRVFITG